MTTDNFIFKIFFEEGENDKGEKMTEGITVFANNIIIKNKII